MELSLYVRMGKNGDVGPTLHFLQCFKDLGMDVGNSILIQEQGMECETGKTQPLTDTMKIFIFSFEKKRKVGVKSIRLGKWTFIAQQKM